ncbi:5'-3' exonuclease [Cryobacterium sp. 10S3]|uniref:5'-3' exonuclease n=2 Tax=Cryobacterium TaxID=69578 RepID=UPI002AC98AFA|nr:MULTISPECIES: 5'-3' exonuclease [unclassified Cryobacterium]MEB0003544.1 5'-3' exonuclease [Cryobacterium sp. RTC2.1]MEB0287531.1 5'-3' exonuclease [Cryobacterium sp. 10S3]WPX15785.1 5'-3' exonuclease [Cryobacterium sp. 10S3]
MLLDTAALYFRAFYGVPDTVRAPNGQPVNAVRGLLDIITRLVTEFPPTEIVACWDDDWRPQWRVDLIPTYKTHRVAAAVESPAADAPTATEDVPDLLSAQVPIIRELLAALGIPVIGAPRHEADDVIGTLASHADVPVDVITGDRDLFQLVDDSRDVRVIYTGRGMARLETLTDAALLAKTGVTPAQYADFAALRGDASDGLPGVAGVGEKTAATLLADFGDLDGIVAAAADPASALAAGVRGKIIAAADYLTVAPTVVNVVRDLKLPAFDARIRPSTPEQDAELDRLSAEWGLTTAMKRVRTALFALTELR